MIRRRFALKDLLIFTALIAIALAWLLDRNQQAGQIQSLSQQVNSGLTEIQTLRSSRDRLRETMSRNMTEIRELRSELRSLMRDVETFQQEIDLATLVSGVEAIEARGTRLDDTVFVTFHNGRSFFRRADARETLRAQRLLIETRMP